MASEQTQNKAQAADVTAGRNLGEEADREEVQVLHPAGKVETKTIGDLSETHGAPMDGPGSSDLNPAFYPGASTNKGGQSEKSAEASEK